PRNPDDPIPPYGTMIPTIKPEFKPEQLPGWDGKKETALEYFWKIDQLSTLGGYIAEAMDAEKTLMRSHYKQFIKGIKDGFLGRIWQLEMMQTYEKQSFRQRGFADETPAEFFGRRIMYSRMLSNTPSGSHLEVHIAMQKMPIAWTTILVVENILDSKALYLRASEHEQTLIYAARTSNSRRQAHVVSGLENSDSEPSNELGGGVSQIEALINSVSEEETSSLSQLHSANDEAMIREAYQVLKKRQRAPPKGGYPFPKNDHVATKMGKLPPSPCKVCGSKNHWDRECPDWAVYEQGMAQSAHYTVLSNEEKELETIYRSAYSVLLNQRLAQSTVDFSLLNKSGFKAAASGPLKDGILGKETCKTAKKEKARRTSYPRAATIEEVEDDEDLLARSKPKATRSTLEQVIFTNGTLESDILERGYPSSEIKRENSDSHAYNSSKEARLGEGVPSTSKLGDLPSLSNLSPPPNDLVPIRLSKKRSPKAGHSSVGISVLAMQGWIGDAEGSPMELRLDTCADITLISEDLYKSLSHCPPIKQGMKMRLCELTSGEAQVQGYVTLTITVLSEEGDLLQTEAEAYIVPGMSVPILLGEDYQLTYELGISRNVEAGTKVLFDKGSYAVPARGVARTTDWEKAKEAAVSTSKFVRARLHKQAQTRKARLRRKWGIEARIVRAAENVRIGPEVCKRVKIEGCLGKDKEWIVQKDVLPGDSNTFFAVPNVLISSENPWIPIANTSMRPKLIRRGEMLGTIERPQEYFDSPTSEDSLNRMKGTAEAYSAIIHGRYSA
ncbi:hypothetical protein C8R44DRAFT_550266, partial [Mycena epipterygia]